MFNTQDQYSGWKAEMKINYTITLEKPEYSSREKVKMEIYCYRYGRKSG